MAACRDGNEEYIKLLLEAGADISLVDMYGYDALIKAVDNGHEICVLTLVNHGAKDRVYNGIHKSALQRAREKGYNGIIEILDDM